MAEIEGMQAELKYEGYGMKFSVCGNMGGANFVRWIILYGTLVHLQRHPEAAEELVEGLGAAEAGKVESFMGKMQGKKGESSGESQDIRGAEAGE